MANTANLQKVKGIFRQNDVKITLDKYLKLHFSEKNTRLDYFCLVSTRVGDKPNLPDHPTAYKYGQQGPK